MIVVTAFSCAGVSNDKVLVNNGASRIIIITITKLMPYFHNL